MDKVVVSWVLRFLFGLVSLVFALSPASFCQQAGGDNADGSGIVRESGAAKKTEPPESKGKRIFGIIPNYRTYPSLQHYEPLSPREKFKIAVQDSSDRGNFVLAGAFAGEGQLTNASPSFGQGVAGYARYFATSWGDLVIGDFMTEAIYPSLLHQDPRYFRRGTGSVASRLGYAMGQILLTHSDSGGTRFNFSEILGNATATAVSNAYYPDNRNAASAGSKLAIQIGVDMAGNILKEFSPDLSRAIHRRR